VGLCVGDLVLNGGPGDDGIALSTTYMAPGRGGSCPRGAPGGAENVAGFLPGGGGGGRALGPSSAAAVGMAGGPGMIVVWEFY
jgi:hypothetical protein